MFRRRIAENVVVLGAIASMQACSTDAPDANALGTSDEAVTGGDTRDVTISAQLPETAVGRIVTPTGGSCSSSMIGRGVVLTAAHCFCNSNKQSLDLNPLHTQFLRSLYQTALRPLRRSRSVTLR
jgi:V8-like Glu-specific endopeptidase